MEWRCSAFEQRVHEGRERSYIEDYPELADYRSNAFLRYLDGRSQQYLVDRKRKVKGIATAEEAAEYREQVRSAFKQALGPLPDCPPGRAEVLGTLDREAYAIDRVRIEGLPGVFVTANFYYPSPSRLEAPCPAVLFPCGHALDGKASPMYVSFAVEAAMNGFCTLIYDPIGQGDRKIADAASADGAWLSPVDAHCLVDRQLSALGEHLAPYFVAESVRALDYLLSRPEVDAARVAVAGNSGGGMMAAYMGAYDDRLQAVAPCCYITELQAMLKRLLAQDAEQCTPGFMARGLDLSDLIAAAAPKPYIVGAALYDFFPIEGVRDAMVEAKRLYGCLGAGDRIQVSLAARGHGIWVETRLAVLQFFCKHFGVPFRGQEGVDYDALPTEEELSCGLQAADIQAYLVKRSSAAGGSRTAGLQPSEVRGRLAAILKVELAEGDGIGDLTWAWKAGVPKLLMQAEVFPPHPGRIAAMLTIESEPGMRIAGLLLEPAGPGPSSRSKLQVVVGPLPDDISLPELGDQVDALLFVEPRGVGGSAIHPRSNFGMFDPETATGYYARLLGETLQGMRVKDVAGAIRAMWAQPGFRKADVELHGREEHALTALYAAALLRKGEGDGPGIVSVHLEGLLDSYQAFPAEPTHAWGPAIFAMGLGHELDVADVLGAFKPGQVKIESCLDSRKKRKESEAPIQ